MKLRYIFTALVATLTLAVSCEKANKEFLDEVKVSSSYVAIPQNGGSTTIIVTATDSWSFDNGIPAWMTVSPSSGSAGETKVTFSAEKALDGRSGSFNLKCGSAIQTINYIQGLPVVSKATCAEVIAGPDAKTYLVTGVCTAIANTTYGNFYLKDDTGEIYIYGTVDNTGAYNWSKFNIEVGDEVTVQGPKTTYNTTVELVDATFISVSKSLIKVDSLTMAGEKIDVIPIEGGEVVANIMCKGKGVSVDIPAEAQEWLSVTGINTSTNKINFNVAPNAAGDRAVNLVFKTTDGKKEYTATCTFTQKGSILDVSIAEYLAAAEDATLYRISGVATKIVKESDKYGTNLYIKDATGEVFIYGTTDAAGVAMKLSTLGIKEGDIIEFVGKRSSYAGTPQMANGAYQTHTPVETVDVATFRALADDKTKFFRLTGVVTKPTESGTSFDLETRGNLSLVDATGEIYVYGVSTGYKGESKKFGTLGVKEGDTMTIIAYKGSYKGLNEACGAIYVSHKSSTPSTDPYETTIDYTAGSNFYDDCSATISGTTVSKILKIGTSKNAGDFTVTIPAAAKKLTFYAVAWKGSTDATVAVYDGDTLVKEQAVAANEGATGTSPFTLTLADTDKYSIDVTGGKTLKITSTKRILFIGMRTE